MERQPEHGMMMNYYIEGGMIMSYYIEDSITMNYYIEDGMMLNYSIDGGVMLNYSIDGGTTNPSVAFVMHPDSGEDTTAEVSSSHATAAAEPGSGADHV